MAVQQTSNTTILISFSVQKMVEEQGRLEEKDDHTFISPPTDASSPLQIQLDQPWEMDKPTAKYIASLTEHHRLASQLLLNILGTKVKNTEGREVEYLWQYLHLYKWLRSRAQSVGKVKIYGGSSSNIIQRRWSG
jgi:hypothetical protein